MTKAIKVIILKAFIIFLRLRRFILRQNRGVVFLAPDIPVSNMGDQALLFGALTGLIERNIHPIFVVANGPEKIDQLSEIEEFRSKVIIIQNLHIIFATDKAFKELLLFYWLCKDANSLVLVGADVLDGRYNSFEASRKLDIINTCNKIGLKTKVVGFSLSENISKECSARFSQLNGHTIFVARDPVSMLRMSQYAKCELGADCAFLMKPSLTNDALKRHRLENIDQSAFIVGLCLRDEDFMTEETSELLEPFLLGLVTAIKQHEGQLLLIPHHPGDIAMLTVVEKKLTTLGFTKFSFIKTLPTAPDVKSLVGICEHVVTSRMHVAIASLGMGTAITCLPYAGKFEGLFEHFELDDAGLDRSRMGEKDYVSIKMSERLTQTINIKQHIGNILEKVKVLSRKNFSDLFI
jgi:polysaccharide pyruvyl transferase WcaK-like protein